MSSASAGGVPELKVTFAPGSIFTVRATLGPGSLENR
jgi:hypothetical protein